YVDTSLLPAEYSSALNFTGWLNAIPSEDGGPAMKNREGNCLNNNSYFCSTTGSTFISANASSGSVGLNTGDTAIIYFKVNNGTLTSLDAGASTTVGIFAGVAGAPLSISIQGES
ncbi:MAG: hypothetical protein QQN60_06035, partial [Nitrosopumilus sp.]